MGVRLFSAAVAVAMLCTALPATAADEDCDPEVERALVENAEAGARDDIRIVRDREMGIRDPESLFDLSCVTDMFDYGHSDILFKPDRAMTDILGLLRRVICDKAREALGRFSGRAFNATVFARQLPLLPGLDFVGERPSLIEEDLRRRERERRRREEEAGRRSGGDVGGGLPAPPAVREAPPPRAPSSRPDLFRSLLGGGDDRENAR